MRLLFVSHSLPPKDRPLENLGGMQRVALELDKALAGQPTLDYSTRFLRAPWKSIHIRTVPFIAASIVRLWWLARRRRIDVVLFSSMVTASVCVLLKGVFRRNGVMSAAIVHGLDVTTPSPIYQRFVPRVFGALDLVMPVSKATGQQCLLRGLEPARLHPVPNGVDVSRFVRPSFQHDDRRPVLDVFPASSELPGSGVLLCSVGRHVRRKGFAWFIEHVMPRLPEQVHYWLAGQGPETETIRSTIVRLGLETRVRLLGRVTEEELEALYRGADLFVMPNIPVAGDMEGFGVVMLEAGMNGMPTVGARLEGIAEVIRNGANGTLVETGDADGFVEAISVLSDERSGLESAAQRAFEFTRTTFSWESVAADYVRVLDQFRNAPKA